MQKSERRLAAIMFTDIVGYTALMNADESAALTLLEKNREIHKPWIEKFGGRMLKEMGDGMLVSFPNASDAILCAALIQNETVAYEYHLRIGLHEGEVIVQNDDIFGDGVNVASRIESLAEPGQILITESVYRNIQNKPGIRAEMLGERYLKNVKEPWKLYVASVDQDTLDAICAVDHGPVENRSTRTHRYLIKWLIIGFVGAAIGGTLWMSLSSTDRVEGLDTETVRSLREKTVTVLPFQGPAAGHLSDFGAMAPYWIVQRLTEVAKGKVIDVGTAETYGDIPADLIERTGLEAVIVGRYFIMDSKAGQFELYVDVIDLKTKEKSNLGHYVGSSDDPSGVLDEATQKIMAIWALSDKKRWAQAPPRYDAFREYERAIDTWGSDYEESFKHLERAFELDTTFYEPILKMISGYNNLGRYAMSDSLLDFISTRDPILDPWTQMRLDLHETTVDGDLYKAAENAFLMAEFDPRDRMSVYSAQYFASRIGRYKKSLSYYAELLEIDHTECEGTGWPTQVAYRALYALGEFSEIIHISDSLDCFLENDLLKAYPQKACVQLDRFDLIDSLMRKFARSAQFTEDDRDWLLEVVLKELYLTGKEQKFGKYTNMLITSKNYQHWGQIFDGNAQPAIDKINDRVQQDPGNYYLLGHLAFMHSYTGDSLEVQKLLERLEQRPDEPYDFGQKKYYMGTLNALLGNDQLAMDFLLDAYRDGMSFGWGKYADDFRLRSLFEYPPFIEFVKPRS